jgi:hypothetical protein
MFKVLTICRNTSVETSHHGFPDAFQLEKAQRWCSLQLHNVHTKVGENPSVYSKVGMKGQGG